MHIYFFMYELSLRNTMQTLFRSATVIAIPANNTEEINKTIACINQNNKFEISGAILV